MVFIFYKYHATGNDFIIIDNRNKQFPYRDAKTIQKLCHRNFGIGADGLILLEESKHTDFKMMYFNADGHPGTMCGNGGRAIVSFAGKLGIIGDKTVFEASDGLHHAEFINGLIRLGMNDVERVEKHETHVFLDTGSPHHVEFHENLSGIDVFKDGRSIRYGAPYFEIGANVNFAAKKAANIFEVRTYERGVENETMSCGTGVTAVALAADNLDLIEGNQVELQTLGGILKVDFKKENDVYTHIHLTGPVTFVFKGEIEI